MEKLKPAPLNAVERMQLGSIQRHPGMGVLVEKIMGYHAKEQLQLIYTVMPDDPDRVTKLDAISSVAFAMQLHLDLIRDELKRNLAWIENEEKQRLREGKKNG